MSEVLNRQEGGTHYQMPIQPVEFIVKNEIPYREANIIKYVVRYKDKNGLEDLKKAKHYLEMLIEEFTVHPKPGSIIMTDKDGNILNPVRGELIHD